MTDRFASAFAPPDPSDLLPSPMQSVQSSLYQRLRRTHGRQAGTVGWLLIRAAQPEHPRHAAALAALSPLGAGALAALIATVRATLAAPTISSRAESRELARAIVEALEGVAALVDLGPVEPAGLAEYMAAVAASRGGR